MNPTTDRTDADFARSLREHVDALAPTIDVDTHDVVPAARRRRRRRAALTGAAAVAVFAAGAGWAAHTWILTVPDEVVPATVVPYVPSDGAPTIDGGWPDAPYWRVRFETQGTDTTGAGSTAVRVDWLGHDDPGLLTEEGEDEVTPIGPSSWAELLIDDERVLVGWDGLYALPTDPVELERLLRDSVEPDRGAGTPDDKVFDMARTLLVGTPAPPALRDALWDVLTDLPSTSALGEVTDARDRSGQGVETTIQGWTSRIVYDPTAHRVLETTGTQDDELLDEMRDDGRLDGVILTTSSRTTYLDEGPADAPPAEPRLEDSGCVSWETC
ncbi:hypothetical protein [Cellulosimicrobium arenosum]|uniref:Uncharacterized protein n=1 Tax=Cellulosimicrobium arenosum TaxID=2708133 RepID=A0A927J2B9_9MICO|nr:hypothetical protein [Cellulosimicrobium arenosum]MBD8080563.1 hypothetical protein [Cellulosimicrobium arenosum]